MTERPITVKWNANTYSLVIAPNEPIELLQAQLLSLTGVPVERQKIMYKAKILKTSQDLLQACESTPTTTPMKLMLVGTAGNQQSVVPAEKTVFIEDLSSKERSILLREKQAVPLPNGIVNVGNTCFLASVLQLLRPVKEFNSAIRNEIVMNSTTSATFAASGSRGALYRIGLSLRDFYSQWEGTVDAASPMLLVTALRDAFPQFSRRSTSEAGTVGVPMQQDAEECLGCIFSALDESLKAASASEVVKALPYCNEKVQLDMSSALTLDALFSIHYLVESQREGDSSGTTSSEIVEKHRKLTCFLGTPSKPVHTLDEGLDLVFSQAETIENAEPIKRRTRICGLSMYLLVHFMRFEWRQSNNTLEKAKICKSVKFAKQIDLFMHCTKELQETFKIGRAILSYRNKVPEAPAATSTPQEAAETPAATPATESQPGVYPTGMFVLQSVLTHQGRYADSGHYIAWASQTQMHQESEQANNSSTVEDLDADPGQSVQKRSKVTDTWIKFDDDKVTEVEWQNIDLCGGRSDFHVAYLLLYKQILVTASAKELQAVQEEFAKPQESA